MTACAAIVRKVDYDRFLSVLFAPAERRDALFALYAFAYEIAKTAETVHEPTLGLIRLQWWRDALEEIDRGTVRRHEVVAPLAAAMGQAGLVARDVAPLIDAREADLSPDPFDDLAALEAYAEATAGALMRLALRVLGADEAFDDAARAAGTAYGLTGLLRALPFLAAQGRVMLPHDRLALAGLAAQDVMGGRAPGIRVVTDEIAARARAHLATAGTARVPRAFLPALLPAALVRPYLKPMARKDFDPFRHPIELSVPRRQVAMAGAMLRRSL